MSDNITKMLAKLTPEDVTMDKFGRLTIANPDLAEALKEAGAGPRLAADDNYGCCKNGVACGQKSLMDTI